MKIYRYLRSEDKNNQSTEVELDENNEFHDLQNIGYEIHLSSEEHNHAKDVITLCIMKALYNEIDAYCAYSRANKFSLCYDQLVMSTDSIIAFSTSNSSECEILDNIVKDIINSVKSKSDRTEKNTTR